MRRRITNVRDELVAALNEVDAVLLVLSAAGAGGLNASRRDQPTEVRDALYDRTPHMGK